MKNPKPEKLILPRSTVELVHIHGNYIIIVTNKHGQETSMTYTELNNITPYMKEEDGNKVLEWLVKYILYMESDAD